MSHRKISNAITYRVYLSPFFDYTTDYSAFKIVINVFIIMLIDNY